MGKVLRFFFFLLVLGGCKKNEIGKLGRTLYDGCPECEGSEYVTSTKKWNKNTLTFAFKGGISIDRQQTIENALRQWEANGNLTLTKTPNTNTADIVISFEASEHGDGITFDGKADPDGNILGHAFFPPPTRDALAGDLHFDLGDEWTSDSRDDNNQPIDLYTVALHEFGHSLGLRHSLVPESIMYPEYKGSKRTLHQDDIDAIQSIYGRKINLQSLPSNVLYMNSSLAGISEIVDYNGKVYLVAGYAPQANSVAGYPDPAIWYKTILVSENGQTYPIVPSSTSASILHYDLSLTKDNLIALTYRIPTGVNYGFNMFLKKFNGSNFSSSETVFLNANWGINPRVEFDINNVPHIISWAAAGYALYYHTKPRSAWQSYQVTNFSNIVQNLQTQLRNNKLYVSARHNPSSNSSNNQTLRLFVRDLQNNQWSVQQTMIAIDNNCDLQFDNNNNLYHLYYRQGVLYYGPLNGTQEIVATQQGIDSRAALCYDNSNKPVVFFQTANKVVALKKQGASWVKIYEQAITINNENLNNTSVSVINRDGQLIFIFCDNSRIYMDKIK